MVSKKSLVTMLLMKNFFEIDWVGRRERVKRKREIKRKRERKRERERKKERERDSFGSEMIERDRVCVWR